MSDKIHRIVLGGEGESRNKVIGLFKNIVYIIKLRNTIKHQETTTIVSFLTRSNIYIILASIGLKKHVVVSERNDTSRQVLSWPWALLRKKIYKHASVVTANSKIAIENMAEYVPRVKLKFLPNPIILPDIKDLAKPSTSKIILNVARLSSHKNHLLLLEAIKIIKSLNSEWKVQILGDGEEHHNIINKAEKLGISDKIILTGFVDNPSEYYKKAAMFVLPSLYEGTPNALLEAMSFGLPCVVSDSLSGALEILDHNESGLVFKNNDSLDLSEKINLLINNPDERNRLGNSARGVVSNFTPEKIISKWESVLKADTI